jgi:hypothetical protein
MIGRVSSGVPEKIANTQQLTTIDWVVVRRPAHNPSCFHKTAIPFQTDSAIEISVCSTAIVEMQERRWAVIGNGFYRSSLEPVTQQFVDTLAASGAFPFSARSVPGVRIALANLQSKPIGKPDASIKDMTLPVGPNGAVRVRIVRRGTR